jgi:hypothetical protein
MALMLDDKTTVLHDEEASIEASGEGKAADESTAVEQRQLVDSKTDRALMWKIDYHVVPPLFVLYLLTFLDRTNIGNAKIQGMTEELGLTGNDFNIILMIFFIP